MSQNRTLQSQNQTVYGTVRFNRKRDKEEWQNSDSSSSSSLNQVVVLVTEDAYNEQRTLYTTQYLDAKSRRTFNSANRATYHHQQAGA